MTRFDGASHKHTSTQISWRHDFLAALWEAAVSTVFELGSRGCAELQRYFVRCIAGSDCVSRIRPDAGSHNEVQLSDGVPIKVLTHCRPIDLLRFVVFLSLRIPTSPVRLQTTREVSTCREAKF